MSPIWKYDERFSKLSSIKFEINLCKTLHPHFFYVIYKVEIGKKKSYTNVHLFKQMLTFMHVTCEFQLWDIFVVADLYTSNYSFKMAKIGSYEYFLVIFAFAQCENNYESPKRILILLKDYANWTQERHERLCIHKRLCAYLPVKFLNPNKKLSRLTLRVFNFIRGGVQL